MAEKIQLRRDTAANWASSNPVLSQGEVGLAIDTKDVKFGDGATPWNALSPWSPNVTKGAAKLASIGDLGYFTSSDQNAAYSTSTVGTSEMSFTVGVAATTITAMWTHFYETFLNPGNNDVDPTGPITFSASLRVASTTCLGTVTNKLYRLTFGGRTTVTLDPGGQITADVLGISVAAGDVVAVRTYLSSGTAYTHRAAMGASGQVGGFTAATDLTATGSAAVAATTGWYYGPAVLLGYAEGGRNAKSVFIMGDSIAWGLGDATIYTRPTLGNTAGFLIRALSGVAGVVNTAVGGDIAAGVAISDEDFRRMTGAPLCNSAIIELGTNDLGFASGAAALIADLLSLASRVRRQGISKVFLCTIQPTTTSTDGWATTANQTQNPYAQDRVEFNTWVRANCPVDPTTKAFVTVGTAGALLAGQYNHPVTGFFEVADTVESSRNSGLWKPCNRVVTGSISSGSAILTAASGNFSSANHEAGGDLGTTIVVPGAGVAGALLVGRVKTVTSSTQITLDVNASTTVTNGPVNVGVIAGDGVGVHPSSHGHYLMSQAINTALL